MRDESTHPIVLGLRMLLAACAIALVGFSFVWVLSRPLRREGAKAGQVVLHILHWGDKEEEQIVRKLVEAFERQNPDVRVVRTNTGSPAQLATKLQTMIAAGDPPDLFYLDFTKIAEIAANGVLEPIEPFVQRDRAARAKDTPNLDDFFPAVLNAFRYDSATRSVGTHRRVGPT